MKSNGCQEIKSEIDRNDEPMSKEKKEKAFLKFQKKQISEILGEDNYKNAKWALGREPTKKELFAQYFDNHGPEDFFRRNCHLLCPLTNQELL
ncbi:MAG: hypothetical protein PF572_00575 [Patescibacteria group bacterium]|jgi:hypothetical protein|nr:hypothetical protein [Patescibacteria group bacterium]